MWNLKPNTLSLLAVLFASSLAGTAPGFADDLPSAARDGIVYYNEGEYKKAVEKFQEAQAEKPDHPLVLYNAGNANYRLGRYETALEDYDKVIADSTDPGLRQKAWYNKGNAYYKLGMLDKAIEAYKKSLELDPKDEDSKFNYEYAKKQLEKAIASGQIMPRNLDDLKKQQSAKGQAQAESTDSKPGQGEPPEHSGAEAPPEESGDTQTAEKEKNQPDEEGADQQEPETIAQPKPPAPSNPEERKMQKLLSDAVPMSPEEAERLLSSLNENLKKYKHRQMQGEMKDLFKGQRKDW